MKYWVKYGCHFLLACAVLSAGRVQADEAGTDETSADVPDQDQPLAVDAETTGLKVPPPEPAPHSEQYSHWTIRWDRGLHYELKQKVVFPQYKYLKFHDEFRKLEGRLGVKIHVDAAAYRESGDIDDIPSDIELRRGRVYTLGNTFLFSPLDFKVEFGFAGTDFFFNEGYVRWNDVPWISTLQLGQFKAPMSLEMMESSGATAFMERGSPVLAFAPGSRLGAQIGGPFKKERVTLTVGLYANVAGLDIGDATDEAVGPMGRLTWLAIDREQDRKPKLLHLGVSVNHVQSRENAFQYRSTPESFIAPFLVDTGEIDVDDALLYGLEVATVSGPAAVRGEFLESRVAGGDAPNLTFRGVYVDASWFFTGESRPYNANKGVFSRVQPRKEFSVRKRQWGAWEAAARFSDLDLSDDVVRGGRMRNLSGGLNWYLTSDTRIMFNYIYSDIDDALENGTVHVLQTRLQVEF